MSYRASLSTGTRKGGQSASAKHKYQNRQDIYLVGRDGVRDDLLASGSGNLPAFAEGDAGKYWLAVDSFERKNARLFVELQLNLPTELSLEQQKDVVKNYMSALCDAEKLSYSWVIHHGKDENPHAHVMVSETKNDSIERPAEQHFKRFNSKYPERGGAQKSASLKPRQWLLDARGHWAIAANDALEKAGFERHFDHRTLKEQRVSALLAKEWRKAASLDREVGEHEGWRVAALRRKHEAGDLTELPEYAKKVIESNDRIKEINNMHAAQVLNMTDAELEQHEREAYFDVLAEREPERFKYELEQLHSEALELDVLHDAHSEALELDVLHDAHSEALELDVLHDAHSEALELDVLHDERSEIIELEEVVRRIEQIDLSIKNQRIQKSTYSIKCEHIKEDYQALKRQQNALAANESIFNKLLSKIGFKSEAQLLEPELERLSDAFSNAKSERELAQSQLTSLKAERDELMQLDISEPLRVAARQRKEAQSDANDAFILAHETLRESKIDKSSRYYIERDLQMMRQELNNDDYTIQDMQSLQHRLSELVDAISDEVQKQIMREQKAPQQQQQQQRPRSGPRL